MHTYTHRSNSSSEWIEIPLDINSFLQFSRQKPFQARTSFSLSLYLSIYFSLSRPLYLCETPNGQGFSGRRGGPRRRTSRQVRRLRIRYTKENPRSVLHEAFANFDGAPSERATDRQEGEGEEGATPKTTRTRVIDPLCPCGNTPVSRYTTRCVVGRIAVAVSIVNS